MSNKSNTIASAEKSERRSGLSVSEARGGVPTSPRAVTRGESSADRIATNKAKVDWMNATFPAPDRYTVPQFLTLLSRIFKREVTGVEGRGIFGFDKSVKLFAGVGSRIFPVGCIAMGGEAQRGRWMLQITGSGCQMVLNWSRLGMLLQALDARLTRLDLAVDFLEGEHTVDDAVQMHADGEFTTGGRPPSTSVAGDWLDGIKGRTLYVGNAANGKMLRVYEKGRQMGDASSPWVRFEVQLGNRDRVIPFAAMTRRDEFLAGCYPALARILESGAEKIATEQKGGLTTVGHLMFHLKRSYGKLLGIVSGFDVDAHELIESVTVIGAPRRLAPATVQAGLSWAQLLAQFNR